MKIKFLYLLNSFDYNSCNDFIRSWMPSIKYGITGICMFLASLGSLLESCLGIGNNAFVALCVVMLSELVSGIWASRVRGEKLSSMRWSRFGLKLGLWFVVLYVSHMIAVDFRNRGSDLVALVIDWTHTVLVLSIFFEYLLSVLENISVIGGRSNATLIEKIRDKYNSLL